ncbi:hypothetical protein [Magnetospirillum moscoviense]|uniref:Bbp19-like phage domain-containing protein n=1 Tax=Magnetospirillum moscoviense TaxID=1437059 RepID=A0A178MVV6_9PROT|nr:hypothetical protein [Magnetospirillum moscoviense]MBF0324711.1 hypothetical protein [Alphaproteobacteria bacterium]OAN54243.1 hypothetical protein A6A05_08715 [Magnetospirillum moscoviense]
MPKSEPGWGWFAPPPPPPDEADRHAVARAFTRAFAGPDGAVALDHLKALTLDRCLGADASEAQLRCLEGQRQLVAHILNLIERGRHEPGL